MKPIILYDNRFADASPVASATALGYDARHISDRRSFTFWKGDGPGTFTLDVDCGGAKDADAIGLASHNLGTAGATVKVLSSATGAWGGEEVLHHSFLPADDRVLMKLFDSASARYWRLEITTAVIAPEVAVVFVGARLTFAVLPDAPYTPFTEEPIEETSIGKTGHALGTVMSYMKVKTQAKFSRLDRTWVQDEFLSFWENHARLRRQFFYAWDLDYSSLCLYVRHTGNWQAPVSILSRVDRLDLPMEGMR